MKKLLAGVLVVLTLVCVLSVAGCHRGEPTPNPITTATTTIPNSTTTTTDHDCFPDYLFGFDNVRCDDKNNWGKVVDGVFTSDRGGLQLRAEDWKTYGLYSISMVPVDYDNKGVTNAICVAVYDADPSDVFANKTEEDFEAVLGADVDTFTSMTVCGYPAYYAIVPNQMYVYVINTPTYKYFINFMQAEGSPDVEAIGRQMMAEGNILIFK